MFDWLEIQINEVKAGSINRVEGVGRGISAEGAAERLTRFPNSYREFCARFGNVFLYKLRNAYQVIVNNTPQQTTDSSGRVLHCFGSNDDKTAYFVDELLEEGDDTPILELSEEGFNLASIGFNEWIWNACAEAIARYEPDEWQVLLAGHLPFSEKERQLIQWRQLYLWECLGIFRQDSISNNQQFSWRHAIYFCRPDKL